MSFAKSTILQADQRVKSRNLNSFIFGALFLITLMGFSKLQAKTTQRPDLHVDQFEAHPNWLGMNLKFEPVAEVRKKVESQEKIILKNRGEAHITVITPPEFDVLKKSLSMDEINQIAMKDQLQKSKIEIKCLGKGQASPAMVTYYWVVKSPALLKVRKDIEKAWKAKGGNGDFEAKHFYPHITVGFTERDLFETDGVIKDERSCTPSLSAL